MTFNGRLALYHVDKPQFITYSSVIKIQGFFLCFITFIFIIIPYTFLKHFILFIYSFFISIDWVLVAVCRIFVASRGVFRCGLWTLQLLCAGLVAQWHVRSQFPTQGSNPHPLHCKVNSKPLDHQGSSLIRFCIMLYFCLLQNAFIYIIGDHLPPIQRSKIKA